MGASHFPRLAHAAPLQEVLYEDDSSQCEHGVSSMVTGSNLHQAAKGTHWWFDGTHADAPLHFRVEHVA